MSKGHARRQAQKRANKQLHRKAKTLTLQHDSALVAYHSTKDAFLNEQTANEILRAENEALRAKVAELQMMLDTTYQEWAKPPFIITNQLPASDNMLTEPSIMTDCEGESYVLDLPTAPTVDALRKAMVLDLD
jgi:hypothetical protein